MRLLCVFAHPDDESYGPGGTIAAAALSGAEVDVLMFTCGEAGTIGVSKQLPREELCRRRRSELEAACAALGVRAHRVVGAPDRGVSGIDREAAVAEIERDIESRRPQVLLTFHHRGVSGHPDHIAVADFLREAFRRTAAPQRLFEWGIPHAAAALYDRPNLVPLEEDEIHAVIAVPAEAMARKIAAIHAHETQIEFFRSMQAKFDYAAESAPEYLLLRESRLPRPATPLSDLFEGIPRDPERKR
jgi:LmbE family N-acetylglucosaminyl deacetylase